MGTYAVSKVLLIEDDPVTHTIVKGVLDNDKQLISCFSIAEALAYLENNPPPVLMIIDRMLPDGDGLAICTQLRSTDTLKDVPIIFLSSKSSDTDKVGGLFAGADDYITKPANPLELKARIQARLRTRQSRLKLGNLTVDLATQRVSIDDAEGSLQIDLTRIEYRLLTVLLQSPDRVFARETLLTSAWGAEVNLSDRVVDTHLSHLRRKVSAANIKIESVRGEGYRLYYDPDRKDSGSRAA